MLPATISALHLDIIPSAYSMSGTLASPLLLFFCWIWRPHALLEMEKIETVKSIALLLDTEQDSFDALTISKRPDMARSLLLAEFSLINRLQQRGYSKAVTAKLEVLSLREVDS